MFGRKSGFCRVFEYGCLPPVSGGEVMAQELFLRNQYWNKLVEIEREFRRKSRELLSVPGDEKAAEIETEIQSLENNITQTRQKNRGMVNTALMNQRIKELREELKSLWKENKEARRIKIKELQAELGVLESERRKQQKIARKESGLFWCNYDDIEKNYEVSRKKAMREGVDLRFHKYDGTGKLSVRYQQGLPVEGLFNTSNNLLQIDPVPPDAWLSPVRSVRRRLARTKICIRVRSKDRKPVFVELPLIMHRPLPNGGDVRGASLVCEKIGSKYRYKLIITVTLPDHEKPEEGKYIGFRPAVGIDMGWRLKDCGGIRVAYWHGEEGRHGEVLLPEETVSQFFKIDDLKSIRHHHFNTIKNELLIFSQANNIPDWLKEEIKYSDKWRSPKKLFFLLADWEANHFDGDKEIYKALLDWQKKERHLYEWESNLRDQVIRRRRELYRMFAASLVKIYGQVFIEDFDLTRVLKRPKAEEGTVSLPPNRIRMIASPGIFRVAVESACSREGLAIKRLDAKYTTRKCHVCGYEEKWNAGKDIMRECPSCKAEWDQDHNAAILLLRYGLFAADGSLYV